jgi:ribose transport system ATP-binding protein
MPETTTTRTSRRPQTDESAPTILQLSGVSKRFGPTQALDRVDLDIRRGEVHALLGHNGAGKSTLIKTLAGVHAPDGGTITLDGQPIICERPSDAIARGIAVVYQELSLFGPLSVAENIVGSAGGGLDAAGGLVRPRSIVRQAREQLSRMGLDIDPTRPVDTLPVGEQQMVEIGRTLSSGARIIVLDEPTSALSPSETRVLFNLVRGMADQGISFILISHFLDEIMDNADRVTVMRGGRSKGTVEVADTTKRELLALSLGDPDKVLKSTYGDTDSVLPTPAGGPLVLRADSVRLAPRVRSFDLAIHRNEIVAIYGEIGCGHEDFAEALFGMQPIDAGELVVLGHHIERQDSQAMRELGVGYIPSDRRRALATERSIADNVTLPALAHISRLMLRPARERDLSRRLIDWLGIRSAGSSAPIKSLSGGNQQKALIARWLLHPPRLLVLSEPTRGMDLRAKSDVLRTITGLRDRGTTVLITTSEPETALAVSDRVLVARRGTIVADFSDCTINARDLVEATL